jgi:hypothetical protein
VRKASSSRTGSATRDPLRPLTSRAKAPRLAAVLRNHAPPGGPSASIRLARSEASSTSVSDCPAAATARSTQRAASRAWPASLTIDSLRSSSSSATSSPKAARASRAMALTADFTDSP